MKWYACRHDSDYDLCGECGSLVDANFRPQHENFHAQIDALSSK